MRKLIGVLLLFVAVPAMAATQFTLTGTFPDKDNAGTCALPVLVTNQSTTIVQHFQWIGASAGEDSISGTKGALFTFTRQVPAGAYSIRSWASDKGGAGCDTTIVATVLAADTQPWKRSIFFKGY